MQLLKQIVIGVLVILSGLFVMFYFWIFPRIIYSFLNEIKKPNKKDRVLVFAPHPDDESLGCFGYLTRAVKSKAKVNVVILTDGYFLSKPEQRYKETIQTLSEIGIKKKDIFFLGFKDIHLRKAYFCSDVMKNMIKSFKPTIIFSTSNYDSNPDHGAAYYHLKKALEGIKSKIKIYYYLIHYKGRMYPFPRGLKTEENIFPPVSLIDKKREWIKLSLSEQETILKNKAIMNYKSQLRIALFLSRKTLLSFIRRNELFYFEKNPKHLNNNQNQ